MAASGDMVEYHESLKESGKEVFVLHESLFSEVSKAVCLITVECGRAKGTGFIGHLSLDGTHTVVLVTTHYIINTMDIAIASRYTFQYCGVHHEVRKGVIVCGTELFDGCNGVHRLLASPSGLDYFMAKVNIDYLHSLKDDTGHPLDITPIDLMDTVDIHDNNVAYIIKHSEAGPRCISAGMIISVIGSLLFYSCHTGNGSGGSPVFVQVDNAVKLVAVHKGVAGKFSGVKTGSFILSILDHINHGKVGIAPTDEQIRLVVPKIQYKQRKYKMQKEPEENEDIRETMAYNLAVAKGETNSSSFSIYVLGQENSGKTCLVATLLGEDFTENIATHGTDVTVCTTHASSSWCRVKATEVSTKQQKRYHCKLRVAASAEITIMTELAFTTGETKTPQELLKTLPKLPDSVLHQVEQAKVAESVDDDGINTVIWDFSGQSVYDGLHCMFLKQGSVIAIVFNASQDLHSPTECRDNSKDPYTEQSINRKTTGCGSVCYWLNTVHSICCFKDGKLLRAMSKFVPTVFLIATHIDKIGDENEIEKKRKQIIDQLVDLLKGHEFAQHLAGIGHDLREALEQFCFFISNKEQNERNKKEVDRLKRELVGAAQYILEKKHPVIYLDIERKLQEQVKPVITTEEFHTIAIDSGFSAKPQSEEFKGALTHFHHKGAILHFPSTELLQNLVVLSPQWLTKLISYVLVAHPYKTSGSCHDGQYDLLQKQGILIEDFIVYMTQRFNEDQQQFGLSLTSEQVINLVKHFKLIAEINRNTRLPGNKIQIPLNDKKMYIVPSMLPLNLPDHIKLPSPKDKHACVIHFEFHERFLPLMMFYQLLADCIERNIVKMKKKNVRLLTRHHISFFFGDNQVCYIGLCDKLETVILSITPEEKDEQINFNERLELIEFVYSKLQDLVKTFMKASQPPTPYIVCTCTCCNEEVHIKLDDILNCDELETPRCDKGKKVNEEYYSGLRQAKQLALSSVSQQQDGSGASPNIVHPSLSQVMTSQRNFQQGSHFLGPPIQQHHQLSNESTMLQQSNTSALPTAPQQAGLQNMQYGMNPSIYPTMPLNPAGAFLPSNHLSSQFVVPQYYFQQQPQPHQPIFTQQQLQYFQSQQPQNQAMTLHQEGYPQSQPGMIQQDHQSSKLPITLQQGTGNKPHLQDLSKYVLRIGKNWSDLGIQLLDRSVVDKLDIIKENNPKDVEACCTAMFKFWISNSEDASWKMLVEKLRKIDLNVLAKEIENEHCK
ncbi:uncharacterized protein [Dysidea avara]|uniref:uncharacterized protein isoform X2 n=1 Tax=Dysidea avara TaxID=196820 RepID=UPI0033264D37